MCRPDSSCSCCSRQDNEQLICVLVQELSWLAGYDDSDDRASKRSLLSIAGEAILLALHRPLAV